MLKAPYNFIHQDGLNKYYTVEIEDTAYIATESIVPLEGDEDFPQGLKLIALTLPLGVLLSVFSESPVVTTSSDGLDTLYGVLDANLFGNTLIEQREKLRTEHGNLGYLHDFGVPAEDSTFYQTHAVSKVLNDESNPALWFTVDKAGRKKVFHLGLNPYGTLVLMVLHYIPLQKDDSSVEYQVFNLERFIYGLDTINALLGKVSKTTDAEQSKEDLQ